MASWKEETEDTIEETPAKKTGPSWTDSYGEKHEGEWAQYSGMEEEAVQTPCPVGQIRVNGKCVSVGSDEQDASKDALKAEQDARKQASVDALAELSGARAAAAKRPAAYKSYVGKLEEQEKALPGQLTRAGAQALAPVYGSFGAGGASSPAAGLAGGQLAQDAKMQAGQAMQKLQADLLEGRVSIQDAEILAHDLGLQYQKAIMEAPTTQEWAASRDAEIQEAFNSVYESEGGTFGTDEENIFANIYSMIKDEEPYLKDKWMRQICAIIESGQDGSDTCAAEGYGDLIGTKESS